MRKFLAAVAIAVLAAFAAPAFAAVNPFVDVPVNHWSYDAIGQLAARGILSGYPDGTYKGRQPTTRYEMASALARALALVDMSKASRQDVELLKKLVVEFKDELDALGVRVDSLDERFGRMESRLGGWRITGWLRQDLAHVPNSNRVSGDGIGYAPLRRARLFFERRFGENESMRFFTRVEGSDGYFTQNTSQGGLGGRGLSFTRFFAEVPIWDGRLTVGRLTNEAIEGPYFLDITTNFSRFMTMGTDTVLLDTVREVVRLDKSFGPASFMFYIAHPELGTGDLMGRVAQTPVANGGSLPANATDNLGMWEGVVTSTFQFTEHIGVDLGAQYFYADDSGNNRTRVDPVTNAVTTWDFKSLWTAFAGVRFDFRQYIALKGIYYYQSKSVDEWTGNNTWSNSANNTWRDDASYYKFIIDAKRDALKFTSLWLEYTHVDRGFWSPVGVIGLFNSANDFASQVVGVTGLHTANVLNYDLDQWRVAGEQLWTDKWSSWFFWSSTRARNGFNNVANGTINHFGLGVSYQLNPNVGFGLGYQRAKFGGDRWRDSVDGASNPSEIRFRTNVTF